MFPSLGTPARRLPRDECAHVKCWPWAISNRDNHSRAGPSSGLHWLVVIGGLGSKACPQSARVRNLASCAPSRECACSETTSCATFRLGGRRQASGVNPATDRVLSSPA